MVKRLTLQQLYGYSVMNWEQYLNKFLKVSHFLHCSFCRDTEVGCLDCRLPEHICSYGGSKGLFKEIVDAETKLYERVIKIINELRYNYEQLNKLDNHCSHKYDVKELMEGE